MLANKELQDDRSLADQNCRTGSILKCTSKLATGTGLKPSGPHKPTPGSIDSGALIPVEMDDSTTEEDVSSGGATSSEEESVSINRKHLWMEENDINARMQYWYSASDKYNCEANTYIVEPDTHYSWLDQLENGVVCSSEFFRCRAAYDITDNTISGVIEARKSSKIIPAEMWPLLPEVYSGSFTSQQTSKDGNSRQMQQIRLSLWKSYLILCNVLGSLNRLNEVRFCNGFYNIIVEHPEKDIAEIIRISNPLIEGFKAGLESAIKGVCRPCEDLNEIQDDLMELISEPINNLLQILHLSLSNLSPRTTTSILILCRMTTVVLDLALVSYVGSHASDFGRYINVDLQSIDIRSEHDYLSDFRCSLKRLACLDGFLDSQKVWVCESRGSHHVKAASRKEESRRLSCLTSMEDFADIWGPVWSIPAQRGSLSFIQQYNVSKGFIARVDNKSWSEANNIVECHWYSWASFSRKPTQTAASTANYISRTDRLLIGATLHLNPDCPYTLNDYENDYADGMEPLGTSEDAWRLETRALGFSAGQYVGINVTGTQKKFPGVTMKEHIWNSFNQTPMDANPFFLNHYLVVEISHCTGNARRLRLKDLFQMRTVQKHLELFSRGWMLAPWVTPFLLLTGDDDQELWEFWRDYEDDRPNISKVICHVLNQLHKTGPVDGLFAAAFLAEHNEHCVKLDIKKNDWASFLCDSPLRAVYAIVNGVCLEYDTPDQNTTTCSNERGFTVLQTPIYLRLKRGIEYVKLEPEGHILKKVRRRHREIQLATLDTQQALTFRVLNIAKVKAKLMPTLTGPCGRGREKFTACIQSSGISYGGRKYKRYSRRIQRNRRPTQNLGEGASSGQQAPLDNRDRRERRDYRTKQRDQIPARPVDIRLKRPGKSSCF
jgi:hypothetical protein